MAKKPNSGKPKAEKPSGPTACVVDQCSDMQKTFGFCGPHFEHYKFGLIRGNGQKAADYEKKFEHFKAYKEKQSAQKVA